MYRGLIYFGRRGTRTTRISGLDIGSLWDIKGKALGKPVYELLAPRSATGCAPTPRG